MTRTIFTIVVACLCTTAVAARLVTYESPCECQDNHGKHRWAEKNDPALPPSDASAIQAVTPSDIFNWQGPTEYLTGRENLNFMQHALRNPFVKGESSNVQTQQER